MSETPIPLNLTPAQIQAAQMLARGKSTGSIIYELKINERTLYRWKKKKEFKELINSILASELAETRFRLAHLANASVSALWELVAKSDKDHTRLMAALHALKLTGVVHLPSPNVTQTSRYVLEPEENEEPEQLIITDS